MTFAMTDRDDLHYPNLAACSVSLTSTSGVSRPPVTLPIECRSAVHEPIPSPYDFAVEKAIMKKKEDRDMDLKVASARSRDELENAVLVKMKSVTGADDQVCIAMLENNGYDLKTSIETFFHR